MAHFITNILVPFLSQPKAMLHQTEISKLIGRPRPTIRRELQLLEKEGVICRMRKGRLTLYSLNFDNKNLHTYLTIAEKTKILQKDIHLQEFIHSITKNFTNDVLIFGSAAEDFKKAQDVDIIIIGEANITLLQTLTQNMGKEPHILNTTYKEITKALKEEIIKKHILIINTENIVRWLYW